MPGSPIRIALGSIGRPSVSTSCSYSCFVADQKSRLRIPREVGEVHAVFVERRRRARCPRAVHDAVRDHAMRLLREILLSHPGSGRTSPPPPRKRAKDERPLQIPFLYIEKREKPVERFVAHRGERGKKIGWRYEIMAGARCGRRKRARRATPPTSRDSAPGRRTPAMSVSSFALNSFGFTSKPPEAILNLRQFEKPARRAQGENFSW